MSTKAKKDPTLDSKWLGQHSDRLLHYEWEMARRAGSNAEMFPDEIADKIGRSKEYVSGIIKVAISRAKLCKLSSSNR